MNKRKLFTLALTLCMIAILAIGGTLAYFTAEDEDTNVFTMGYVSIQQLEHQVVDGKLVELDADTADEALKLMPVIHTGSGNYPNANPTTGTGEKLMIGELYSALDVEEGGVAASERWAGAWTEANVVDKMVSVYNDGDNDVYVRTIIAIPEKIDDAIVINRVTGSTWDEDEYVAKVEVDGLVYDLHVYTYKRGDGILEPKRSTGPSLMQVLMVNDVDNESIPAEVADGFKILVASQAVQADGFAETFSTDIPQNALNEAFGEITATNNPWA